MTAITIYEVQDLETNRSEWFTTKSAAMAHAKLMVSPCDVTKTIFTPTPAAICSILNGDPAGWQDDYQLVISIPRRSVDGE